MGDIKFTFTGKMSVLIEVEEHGPIVYNVNDLRVVKDVVGIILDAVNDTTPVSSYNKKEQAKFTKILDGFS